MARLSPDHHPYFTGFHQTERLNRTRGQANAKFAAAGHASFNSCANAIKPLYLRADHCTSANNRWWRSGDKNFVSANSDAYLGANGNRRQGSLDLDRGPSDLAT